MNGLGSPARTTTVTVAVLAFVGFWLLLQGTGASEIGGGLQLAALIAGLVLFVGAAVVLFRSGRDGTAPEEVEIGEPAFARFLFSSPRSAPLWLGVRLYLGYEWFEAGRHKITDPTWMDGGTALRGFWERAVTVPEQGRPPITYDPYRDYLSVHAQSRLVRVVRQGDRRR